MQLSQASGEGLGKVLSTLARCGLKVNHISAEHSAQRFAVFDVPSDASVILASQIQRVIDEEGCS